MVADKKKKEKTKSTQMTYFFRRDSEVFIWWTLYCPMRPWGRICGW